MNIFEYRGTLDFLVNKVFQVKEVKKVTMVYPGCQVFQVQKERQVLQDFQVNHTSFYNNNNKHLFMWCTL